VLRRAGCARRPLDRARTLARREHRGVRGAGADVVVVNAAGCGAIMKEYGEQLKDDPVGATGRRLRRARPRPLRVPGRARLRQRRELVLRVTYDAPCHLHHAQRIRHRPLHVLDTVPGLEHVPLPDADECCGGAGLYGVHHPELGGRILADKVAAIRAPAPRWC
jgi:glycolate oxidase iron-sulfur subunit